MQNFALMVSVVIVSRAIDDIAGILVSHMLTLGVAAAIGKRKIQRAAGAAGQDKPRNDERQTNSRHLKFRLLLLLSRSYGHERTSPEVTSW